MSSPHYSAAKQVPEYKDFLIHEYDALRAQILKQIDVGYQLVNFTLTFFGIVLALKLTNGINELALLAYPVVALALARGWLHADTRAHEIGTYIKKNIESVVRGGKIGWEHYLEKSMTPDDWYRESVVLVFLGTELLAIMAATLFPSLHVPSNPNGSLLLGILFVVAALLSFVITIKTFWKFLKKSIKQKIFICTMSDSKLMCLYKIASGKKYEYDKSDSKINIKLKSLTARGFIESTEPGKQLDIENLPPGSNLVDDIRPTRLGWRCIIMLRERKKVKEGLGREQSKNNVKEDVWEAVREERIPNYV